MHLRQPNWTRILTILLVILASLALLYIAGSILFRFKQAILLFVLGAIVAYILTPLVNRLEGAFRFRWLAILLSYAMIAIALFALGLMLFTPFIQQMQSLVDNLHNPSAGSLRQITLVENASVRIRQKVEAQRRLLLANVTVSPDQVQQVSADIAALQVSVSALRNGTVTGIIPPGHIQPPQTPGRVAPNPSAQTRVPPTYVDAISAHVNRLSSDYAQATVDPRDIKGSLLVQAISDAKKSRAAARAMYHTMATTPILLLRSQTWLDQHGIRVDLHSKFGDAASQVSSQGSLILDNAITILSETANILLDFTLVLIISFYFLNDGGRLLHKGLDLVPFNYREQVWFFISSLDKVLGGYIRGQLFLSVLAGILGGGGAAALGVPYPLLIGIVTFLLESIPVIGPMVAVVPAVTISLFFMPFVTTVILTLWFIVFQQVVTNVLGPRIMGMAVGIHPLEALVAVLVGFPLGGFLGAFLAVPVMGIVHILMREAYAYFVLGHSLPTAAVPVNPDLHAAEVTELPEPTSVHRTHDSAAG